MYRGNRQKLRLPEATCRNKNEPKSTSEITSGILIFLFDMLFTTSKTYFF